MPLNTIQSNSNIYELMRQIDRIGEKHEDDYPDIDPEDMDYYGIGEWDGDYNLDF